MRLVHTVHLSVFCKEGDDKEALITAICRVLGMSQARLAEQKIRIGEQNASGFNETRIIILSVELEKERHISAFLSHLLGLLSPMQKKVLASEAELRLSEDLAFYLRLDRRAFIRDSELLLTQSGDCIHLRMVIAAFPRKRDVALDAVRSIFSDAAPQKI